MVLRQSLASLFVVLLLLPGPVVAQPDAGGSMLEGVVVYSSAT